MPGTVSMLKFCSQTLESVWQPLSEIHHLHGGWRAFWLARHSVSSAPRDKEAAELIAETLQLVQQRHWHGERLPRHPLVGSEHRENQQWTPGFSEQVGGCVWGIQSALIRSVFKLDRAWGGGDMHGVLPAFRLSSVRTTEGGFHLSFNCVSVKSFGFSVSLGSVFHSFYFSCFWLI